LLIATTTGALTNAFGDAEAARIMMTLLTQGVRVALWIIIIDGSIDIIRMIYRTVSGSK